MAGRFLLGALLALNMNLAEARTITHDLGGKMMATHKAVKALGNEQVRIDGLCASACTLHLRLPNVCATPRARLGFHAAISPDPRFRNLYTKAMWAAYPGWVKSWITARGGLTKRELVMPRKDIRLPACN